MKAAARIERIIDLIEMYHAYAAANGIRFLLTITETGVHLTDNARD